MHFILYTSTNGISERHNGLVFYDISWNAVQSWPMVQYLKGLITTYDLRCKDELKSKYKLYGIKYNSQGDFACHRCTKDQLASCIIIRCLGPRDQNHCAAVWITLYVPSRHVWWKRNIYECTYSWNYSSFEEQRPLVTTFWPCNILPQPQILLQQALLSLGMLWMAVWRVPNHPNASNSGGETIRLGPGGSLSRPVLPRSCTRIIPIGKWKPDDQYLQTHGINPMGPVGQSTAWIHVLQPFLSILLSYAVISCYH